MPFLKTVLIILHLITAAAWFGMGLRLSRQARMISTAERAGALALAEDGRQVIKMMGIFAILTLVFGTLTMVAGGGFGYYRPQYHTSLLLLAGLVALQYLLIQPSWNGLTRSIGDTGFEAGRYQGRIAAAMGIAHLVWLIVLVLMFWWRLTGTAPGTAA